MRFAPMVVGLGVCLASLPARAAPPPQVLPLAFDTSIAKDPAGTQSEITQAEMGLAPLPLDELVTLKTSGVTLWYWPENAAALTRAGASGPAAMTWPAGTATCAKHDAFTLPPKLRTTDTPACTTAESEVRAALADLGACADIDQPELYVLGYKPASPDATVTGSIEGLVGLAGEALSHATVPAGLLPSDFVANLRRILLVLRHDALAARATQSHAGYTQALSVIGANASCALRSSR